MGRIPARMQRTSGSSKYMLMPSHAMNTGSAGGTSSLSKQNREPRRKSIGTPIRFICGGLGIRNSSKRWLCPPASWGNPTRAQSFPEQDVGGRDACQSLYQEGSELFRRPWKTQVSFHQDRVSGQPPYRQAGATSYKNAQPRRCHALQRLQMNRGTGTTHHSPSLERQQSIRPQKPACAETKRLLCPAMPLPTAAFLIDGRSRSRWPQQQERCHLGTERQWIPLQLCPEETAF